MTIPIDKKLSSESLSSARFVRITPQKARRMANLIRNKKANEAVAILKYAPQNAAETFLKILNAAIAGAKAKSESSAANLNEEKLVISRVFVDEGATMKRTLPRAKGRANRLEKKTSHITIVVNSLEDK